MVEGNSFNGGRESAPTGAACTCSLRRKEGGVGAITTASKVNIRRLRWDNILTFPSSRRGRYIEQPSSPEISVKSEEIC